MVYVTDSRTLQAEMARKTMARKKRKTTADERAAELRRRDDLTRRLQERIDYHKARLAAADGAQDERRESS